MAEEAPLLSRRDGSEALTDAPQPQPQPRLSKDAQLRAAARAAREADAAEPDPLPAPLPRPRLQRRGASVSIELPPELDTTVEKPPPPSNKIQEELAKHRDAVKAAAEEAVSGPVREAREARAKARDERKQKRGAEREARKQARADKRNNKKPPGEGAKRAAAAFGNTLKKLPLRFSVVTNTVKQTVSLAQGLGFLVLLLLVVFIIHQLFLWVDQDPEIAFDRAALLFEVAEVTYDTSGILVNAVVDVANAAIIPIWNTASYYVVEPFVILVLELFMLVFTQKHYTGIYSETDFPYMGLDCTASATAAEWCGASPPHPSHTHARARRLRLQRAPNRSLLGLRAQARERREGALLRQRVGQLQPRAPPPRRRGARRLRLRRFDRAPAAGHRRRGAPVRGARLRDGGDRRRAADGRRDGHHARAGDLRRLLRDCQRRGRVVVWRHRRGLHLAGEGRARGDALADQVRIIHDDRQHRSRIFGHHTLSTATLEPTILAS